jgi:tetratricopeptide (TPR) repeat protein
MSRRLFVFVLLVSSSGSFISSAAQTTRLPDGQTATIEGRVHSIDDHPVSGARVILSAALKGTRLSTYSGSDGSFEFSDLAEGAYLLSATMGVLEVTDQVQVNLGPNWVSLTMPSKQPSEADPGAPVSVAQLGVPGKAHNALLKAWDAMNKNKTVDAARLIEKALAVFPRYAEALMLRAALELQDNSRELALTDAQKAVEYDPNYGRAYFLLGSTYNSLGRFDDAVTTLDRGLAIAPNTWQGHYELSKALLAKGDAAAALREAEKASSLLSPRTYPALHLVKAYAYMGLKNESAASAEIETFQRLDPMDRRSGEAKQMLEKLRASSPDK